MVGQRDTFKDIAIQLANSISEDEVRSNLRQLFQVIGSPSWRLECQLDDGVADMVNFTDRILVETKRPGEANPSRPGSRRGETQYEQIARYMSGLLARNSLFDNDQLYQDWHCYLTDGGRWWAWRWNEVYRTLEPIAEIQNFLTPDSQEQHRNFLKRYFTRTVQAKDIPPENITQTIIRPELLKVIEIQKEVEDQPFYQTKVGLWRKLLQGSGIIPDESRPLGQADTFCRHSLIVSFARLLIAYLDNEETTITKLIGSTTEGFQGWICETPIGEQVLRNLAYEIRSYNWRGSTKDVLKQVYHSLIERDQRREFGEYYTPDNLAELIINRSLDDTWCDDAITRASLLLSKEESYSRELRQNLGFLDPACGSGTFLFHAAKRILRRIQDGHVELLAQCPEIVARLVHGIDIHPVAVEMAKATLATALPPTFGKLPQLRVVLGDAMQTHTDIMFQSEGLRVVTPRGKNFLVPVEIVNHPDSASLVTSVVTASYEQTKLTMDGMHDDLVKPINNLIKSLSEVIAEEGDHIWAWHIQNSIEFALMTQDRVGRLVGNPPWLVRNETLEGTRKRDIDRLHKELGLEPTQTGSSAKGDLAATFSARVTSLYLGTKEPCNQFTWVLPGSALINQTWNKWREGSRELAHPTFLSETWNLDDVDPPVFDHAPNGTCVIFGRQAEVKIRSEVLNLVWSGPLEVANVTRVVDEQWSSSPYLNLVERGAFYSPETLFLAVVVRPDGEDTVYIDTQIGSKKRAKGRWFQCEFKNVKIEKDALLPVIRSQDLVPFKKISASAYLIAIRNKIGDQLIDPMNLSSQYPLLVKFWKEAELCYSDKRTENSSPTLFANLDYRKYIQKQLKCSSVSKRTKVVYNKAGDTLRATRIRGSEIAGQTLYWLILSSVEEAQYILGILNAPCLQELWKRRRTSKIDYHKSVFRNTPIPLFDSSDDAHQSILEVVRQIESKPESPLTLLDEAVTKVFEPLLEK